MAGRIDDDGAAITLSGISLDGIDPTAVPSPVRPLYEALDLKGAVTEARFNYSHERGVVVTMVLDAVDITPPVPAEPGAERPLRMHDTSGTISLSQSGLRASLSGTIEDLPYEVELDYMGVATDSPFTATLTTNQFAWSERPNLLPYAPPIVQRRLANFSNPTAVVDATVTVARDEPTESGPAPVTVDGRLEFVQGEAAFDKFPYPFQDMTARVHFTDKRIVIEEVTGVSPSGAPLAATALIEPLTTSAYVNVDIVVQDVPIDDLLLECLGPNRRQLVDAILSRREYARLLDAGVISLDGVGSPRFELGGVGNMKVNVQREAGDSDIWRVLVDVYFDEVGFLVDRFPYPIIGTDVVLRIDDDRVELIEGNFTGLEGGHANVTAEAVFVRGDGGGEYIPRIHVDADDVPLGDLIASALPDAPIGEAEISPRHIVASLGMDGLARASIDVALREDGTLGYDATAEIRQATSAPAPLEGAEPMIARDIDASLVSSENALHVNATAVIGDGAEVELRVDSEIGLATASYVTAGAVDTTLPLECYVAIFSPDAARELRDTRLTLCPEGVVDLDVRSTSIADEPTTTTVQISVPDTLALDLFEGRIAMADVDGSVMLEASTDPRISFLGTRARLTYDGAAPAWSRSMVVFRSRPWPSGRRPRTHPTTSAHCTSSPTTRSSSPAWRAGSSPPTCRQGPWRSMTSTRREAFLTPTSRLTPSSTRVTTPGTRPACSGPSTSRSSVATSTCRSGSTAASSSRSAGVRSTTCASRRRRGREPSPVPGRPGRWGSTTRPPSTSTRRKASRRIFAPCSSTS